MIEKQDTTVSSPTILFEITATIRGANSPWHTPWLQITKTNEAPDLKTARQQFLDEMRVSKLEYGTLDIAWGDVGDPRKGEE